MKKENKKKRIVFIIIAIIIIVILLLLRSCSDQTSNTNSNSSETNTTVEETTNVDEDVTEEESNVEVEAPKTTESTKKKTSKKAKATYTAPKALSLTYNEESQTLIKEGSALSGTMEYKLGADGVYGAELPSATNAGTYKVYYQVVGGNNDFSDKYIKVKIKKANQAAPPAPAENEATDVMISVYPVPEGKGVAKYAINTKNVAPKKGWQEELTFDNLTEQTDYWLFARYEGNENYNPSPVSASTATGTCCFAAGTKITMANKTIKNIEDVKCGDKVLTFNHETGEYEAQEVYLAFKGEDMRKSFTLHFDNGTSVSIVSLHDLFEQESLQYVTISENNAQDFVGKHFYNSTAGKYVKLLSVTYESKPTEYYSLYTKYNFNCIANGMLSAPDDIDEMLNIYEFEENLNADMDALQEDIAKFGLLECNENNGYTATEYAVGKFKYLNIVVGKGLASWEELWQNREEYLELKK